MIRNYLKIAVRNILKRKLYSFINAFGLSVGIAFCLLIYLFIQDERSFDRFHANGSRIYRVHGTSFDREKLDAGDQHPYESHAYLPAKLAEVLAEEAPEVEQVTRFKNGMEGVFRYQDKKFKERVATVDSGFFKMFSFPVIKGDVRHIFRNPTDAVLTEAIANKYFGDEDPIGKMFTFAVNKEVTYTVAAVVASPPANSSLKFDFMLPMTAQPFFENNRNQWGSFSYPTFVMLKEGTTLSQLKTSLDALTEKYMSDRLKRWRENDNVPKEYKVFEFGALPLTDIHNAATISWDRVSDPKYSWILGGIALLILVIACINYISLALTTSASRRIEVGIRKVIGAQRSELVYQFSLESVLLAFLSTIVGLVLVLIFLPAFNEFTDKDISFLSLHWPALMGITIGLGVAVGLLAGSYPSAFLSRFLPAAVLKGKFTSRVHASFTKPLVVFQFFISASLIICSVIMFRQMDFITKKDLGYDKNHLVAVDIQSGYSSQAEKNVEALRASLSMNSFVMGTAGTNASFNQGWSKYGYKIKEENKSAFVYRVDADYIPCWAFNWSPGAISTLRFLPIRVL